MRMRFEWNPGKAASNLLKHGVTFEKAVRAFADPFALFEPDRVVDGEERWQTIGVVDGALMLMVAHLFYEEGDVEVIRLISARQANRKERRRYEGANGSV